MYGRSKAHPTLHSMHHIISLQSQNFIESEFKHKHKEQKNNGKLEFP